MRLALFLICFVLAACSASTSTNAATHKGGLDLGVIAIGEKPKNNDVFKESSCQTNGEDNYSDCQAKDAYGRAYTFFDGALSRVSAKRGEVPDQLPLPAEMKFGEKITFSAEKASKAFKIRLDKTNNDGAITYSSDLKIKSKIGVAYSLELISDKNGNLLEIVQRTDY